MPSISYTNNACALFEDTFKNASDFARSYWVSNDVPAFKYVPKDDNEYDMAYTMWFFSNENPNDDITQARNNNDSYPMEIATQHPGECTLGDYNGNYHFEKPRKQDSSYTECTPWAQESCCPQSAVENPETLKNKYGEKWAWDVCGPLTPACERFFVQEGCFYECDINVGYFRHYHPSKGNCELGPDGKCHDDINNDLWKLEEMPIKADYFDAMWLACRGNMFCKSDFETCYAEYHHEPHHRTNLFVVVIWIMLGAAIIGLIGVGAMYFNRRCTRTTVINFHKTNSRTRDIDMSTI